MSASRPKRKMKMSNKVHGGLSELRQAGDKNEVHPLEDRVLHHPGTQF